MTTAQEKLDKVQARNIVKRSNIGGISGPAFSQLVQQFAPQRPERMQELLLHGFPRCAVHLESTPIRLDIAETRQDGFALPKSHIYTLRALLLQVVYTLFPEREAQDKQAKEKARKAHELRNNPAYISAQARIVEVCKDAATQQKIDEHTKEIAIQQKALDVHGIAYSAIYQDMETSGEGEEYNAMDKWQCTFTNTKTGSIFAVNYRQGLGHRFSYRGERGEVHAMPKMPKPLEVLYCVDADDVRGLSFDEWAQEYGYDFGKKSHDIYRECKRQIAAYKKAFPRKNIVKMLEACELFCEEIETLPEEPQAVPFTGQDFVKVVHIGSGNFCKITYTAGKLSITGVQRPLASGNCKGSCGQIDSTLKKELGSIKFAKGWTLKMLVQFLQVWGKYHLNDMQPGTPEQMQYLAAHKKAHKVSLDYTQACEVLKSAGLYEVEHDGKPYKYGHAWIKRDVPQEALEFLYNLPEADKRPAWI